MSANNASRRVMRGRQRIPLSKIVNESKRLVTFSKRRTGLFKKASEISALCGVEILLVVFSPSGKAFTFSNPSLGAILNKYYAANPSAQANPVEELFRGQREADMRFMASQIDQLEALIGVEKEINQALREEERGRPSVSDLPLSELLLRKHRMEMLRTQVLQKLNQPPMPVQTQPMTAHFNGATLFESGANNHNAGSSGPSHI